jgi:hypothetical protein
VNSASVPSDGASVVATPKRLRRRGRINWPAIEIAFVHGDVSAQDSVGPTERTYPTLADVAARYAVSLRQVAERSRRDGWVQKRTQYQNEFASALHRQRIRRKVREAEQFDVACLTLAKLVINDCLRQYQRAGPDGLAPQVKDAVTRAGERAQKIGRVAMSLPTELEAEAGAAEKRAGERAVAPGVTNDTTRTFLDNLGKLPEADMLRVIDQIFGGTPAGVGTVIDIKALPERAGPISMALAGPTPITSPKPVTNTLADMGGT